MKSAALSNTLSPLNVSPSISTSLILTEFLYRFLSTYHWPFSCSGMTVLLKSANRIPGANILGVVKGTHAISSCISKEPINLCTEWTHRVFFCFVLFCFFSCFIIRATSRSFPSIALHIPTAHDFTRDWHVRIKKWRLLLFGDPSFLSSFISKFKFL